jgi:hypothetical protein
MNQGDHDLIRLGLERRLEAVEPLIPSRPTWRAMAEHDLRPVPVRVVAGPALRRGRSGGRRLGLVLALGALILVVLAYGLSGGGWPSPLPSEPEPRPTTATTTQPTAEPGALRPVVEPRLIIPVRPKTAWTVVEDAWPYLDLVFFFDDLGSTGYNVGIGVFEPLGVYDPVVETTRLPLPVDLIAWIGKHPDLDAGDPVDLTVAGLPARAIDVTVTYRAGGLKGQTAQFIYDGVGSWNLEAPNKMRIVVVELPDRPLLIVFGSRPEFFDAGVKQLEDLLPQIRFEDRGPSP